MTTAELFPGTAGANARRTFGVLLCARASARNVLLSMPPCLDFTWGLPFINLKTANPWKI